VVGERDVKFQALGRRMAGRFPHAQFSVIPGGHGLPLESPAALARAI
jgi:pimeloyl-ACP methyl ester carboxylesterase